MAQAKSGAGRMIVLECVYARGRYPKYNLRFVNGRALVTQEKYQELRSKKEFGREFGPVGQVQGQRDNVVHVTRGAGQKLSGAEMGAPAAAADAAEGLDNETEKATDSPTG